jgi:HTH-type transcriptional regulator/antitoxin HigA
VCPVCPLPLVPFAPDPITAIKFRMEQQGLSRRDIEPYIGSRARVSEVMTGKRPLTLDMVRRVRDGLGISADLLIGQAPSGAAAESAATPKRESRASQSHRMAKMRRAT